jgi:xanthine dehydrogenase iron-sulfur cluster and FAD-binding subunit A
MTRTICFFLNQEKIEIELDEGGGLRPDTTLLNWLRERRKLTGTKEG